MRSEASEIDQDTVTDELSNKIYAVIYSSVFQDI